MGPPETSAATEHPAVETVADDGAAPGARHVTRTLSEIAEIVSETLELDEVFDRVAATVRRLIPFDDMRVVRVVDGERVVLHAHSGEPDDCSECCEKPLDAWSPRWRPQPDRYRIEDAAAELDPSFTMDAEVIEGGMRSSLWEPFRQGTSFVGGVWLCSPQSHAFSDRHQRILQPIAALLGSAVSHYRLAEEARITLAERERAQRLEATVESLSRELESRGRSRIVGVSRAWKDALHQVGRVASSETTVLITGESGTGKEVIAGLIHEGSPRSARPLVAINCAALPEQLLESELFGHEKGAFTGAVATKIGRIEQAGGGTLFLDEIAEMDPLLQAKLLRVLEQREFQRVGGTRTLEADVRIVAATNRDLMQRVAERAFREDLYYRLNVFEVQLPPLRERPDDILPLADSFLEELSRTMRRPAAGISRAARDWLLAYHWPGNVRELRNAIERALLLCDGGLITHEHLGTPLAQPPALLTDGVLDPSAPFPPQGVDLGALEQSFVEKALSQAEGNKSKAARLLGLTRSQLYTRLARYGID